MLQPKKEAIKKELFGKKTKDSTEYFKDKSTDLIMNDIRRDKSAAVRNGNKDPMTDRQVKSDYSALKKSNQSMKRQKLKGQPGHDANGYPIDKKSSLQNSKDFVSNKKK